MFGKKKPPSPPPADPVPVLLCSFCNKSQRQVKTMISGPKVQICNECIEICLAVLNEDVKDGFIARKDGWLEPEGHQWPVGASDLLCSFCRMPTAIEHTVMVPDRGILCPGCIGAIEAAVAITREQ